MFVKVLSGVIDANFIYFIGNIETKEEEHWKDKYMLEVKTKDGRVYWVTNNDFKSISNTRESILEYISPNNKKLGLGV